LTAVEQGGIADEADFDVVHADILSFFPELVLELGGDPDALLRATGIDPDALAEGRIDLGYRRLAELLELAAAELGRPDFGLRLARLQGGGRVFGPMGVVMRHSRTFGEAIDYVARHPQAHSLAARVRLERDPATRAVFAAHEILLDRLPNRVQLIEQILLLGHLNALEITGGRARGREIRFRHRPLAAPRTYRRYFGCEVRFDQQEDGIVYAERDLAAPIVDRDVEAYETATSFIDHAFPHASPPMHAQVRGVVLQLMGSEACSNSQVAAALHLHPRTLHRRLKAEGRTFQEIKDEVRRDVALYYLQRTDVDLTHIAQKLGYAEHSVLTRSCARWFAASPSRLRSKSRDEDEGPFFPAHPGESRDPS
jgi:AraC-like DNA-binding protein